MFKSRIVLVRNWSPGSRSAKLNGSKHIQKHDQYIFSYTVVCVFLHSKLFESISTTMKTTIFTIVKNCHFKSMKQQTSYILSCVFF